MVDYLQVIMWLFLYTFIIQHEVGAQDAPLRQIKSDTITATGIIPDNGSPFIQPYKKLDSTELDLTVYPATSCQSKAPAIIFFFGGGWKAGSVRQFKPHARYFTERGLTGILVDYRVSSRHHTSPFDAVEDAKDAVDYIAQNADRLGIDENSIIVAGGSAGGHLALMSSFRSKFKPAGLVLFNPVVNTGPEGYGYERIGDNYKAISPIDQIPENPPPMIIFLGTKDTIVSVAQAKEFCRAVELNNGICKLRLYQGQRHGFFNYKNSDFFLETVREADRFLIRQQLIEGEPHVRAWLQERD